MTDHTEVNPAGPPERDLRLDLLRGIGQWMVFLDHTPYDIVGWLTIRNYGFSDATEFFVFISGYCAGYIYGPAMRRGEFIAVTKRLFRRAWQLYIAHIFLFLLFTAQIARSARHLDNPMYEHEFNVFQFLQHPDVMIEQALTLRYKPVNLDVLPLFIVFMLASPFMLWGLVRRPNWCLFGSAVLYFLAHRFGWNLPSFPHGTTWYFNPFDWQLMFVFGAWCACGGGLRLQWVIRSRTVMVLAVAMLVFGFLIAMTWHVPSLKPLVPHWLHEVLYPMSKTNMDPPRVVHFLAALVLIARFLPSSSAELSSTAAAPVDPVRTAFASHLLLRRAVVVRCPLVPGSGRRRRRRANSGQHRRHHAHGCRRLVDVLVSRPSGAFCGSESRFIHDGESDCKLTQGGVRSISITCFGITCRRSLSSIDIHSGSEVIFTSASSTGRLSGLCSGSAIAM